MSCADSLCCSKETSSDKLAAVLMAALPCDHVMVEDVSACGCGQKFNLYAASAKFEGVPLLDRHRLVQEHLKDGTLFSTSSCASIPQSALSPLPCCYIAHYSLHRTRIPACRPRAEIAKLHAITLKLWGPQEWVKKQHLVPATLKDYVAPPAAPAAAGAGAQ